MTLNYADFYISYLEAVSFSTKDCRNKARSLLFTLQRYAISLVFILGCKTKTGSSDVWLIRQSDSWDVFHTGISDSFAVS